MNYKIPPRPASYVTRGDGATIKTEYESDGNTVKAVYIRGRCEEDFKLVPRRSKPKWYEIWRIGEIDHYGC